MTSLPLQKQKLTTSARNEMVEVTDHLRQLISRKNILEGMLIVYVPHTTAAVTINENADPDVKHDMLAKLSELVPKREKYYQHAEGNSDSHVKSAMVGQSVTVLVEAGRLVLGGGKGCISASSTGRASENCTSSRWCSGPPVPISNSFAAHRLRQMILKPPWPVDERRPSAA